MILDKLGQLSDSQAFTTDDLSTKSYDKGGNFSVGGGEPLAIVINVEVAGSGAGAYKFSAIQSAAEALSGAVIIASIEPLEAALTAGSVHIIDIPPVQTPLRYLGLAFDNVSGSTAVTVSAHVVPRTQAYAYKSMTAGFAVY
jgi:hypothetical protein